MSDCLFLCATTRLAQTLRGAVPAGARVWRTPRALTLGQWLAALAEEAALSGGAVLPQVLDPLAEALLWEQVIDAALAGAAPLFDLPGMARTAAEAHALCRVWNLQPGGALLAEEVRSFLGWQAEFERRCRAGGWCDSASLHLALMARIEAGEFALPAAVVWVGFDRLTPLEQRLIAALTARGVAVENRPAGGVDRSRAVVLACDDAEGEISAAVAWAADRLAAQPEARLGIVAPNLADVRDRLEFRLDDVLHPALIRPDGAGQARCFNFSLGRALAEQPLVRVALELLALGGGRAKVEQARLSALLLAGGWSAAASEADGRARLDLALRRDLPYFTTLPALLRLGQRRAERGENLCPHSRAALAALHQHLEGLTRKLRPGEWAAHFRAALKAVGWPGERALSSSEFQARRAFAEALDQFAALDPWLGALSQGEAVRRLGQCCAQRLFQPETRGQPAIQVLGVLESAGLEFDALWVMGMNDDQWPPAPRPNPLLPAELLRAAGAAHASAEVELDFARAVHARLLRAAPEIHFSCARADGNRLLRPSPLLAGLPAAGEALTAPPTLAQQLAACAGQAIERLDDAQAPPVAEGEKVRGGSGLLRAQAICPAWAFYRFRLGAEAMEAPVEGLDPAARGTLVHAALEIFWTALGTSAALHALDAAGRRQAIAEAVAAALARYEEAMHSPLPPRFRALEAARLERLLAVWLALEMQRDEPFTVEACEQEANLEIEGIQVRMVVDRIDRLGEDGPRVIIDYKTGRAIDVKNWAGERLTEPQLPIYAALVEDDVAAVVFAKVLLDQPAFAGVADAGALLPGVQAVGDGKQKIFDPERFPDWPAVVAHWQARLLAIAREVRAGVAGVVFADEGDLRYCDVLPLLRLPERARLLAEGGGK